MNEVDPEIELRRLRALRETKLLSSQAAPELDEICRSAKEHFKVSMALVTLIDKEVQLVKARAGTDLEATPRNVAFCDYTIRSNEVLVVTDATRDPRFALNPLVTGEPFIRFYAGAPLIYRNEIRFGALCLLDPKPREFSLGDRAELMFLAEEVVNVIAAEEIASSAADLGL